ncbi:hypothetical protein EJ08DRAFT_587580 [Tothia fuscella]|uniref:Zn(2)-C6 fungal-type domain-containing protein n=1 Tax=Tothia fuscella TaxID=1048955 RepID=A0A9P4TZW2_9PEZI|nr:hypothetical protein EJ08DRAFT_587580 [Tothia fuscella]
MNTVGHSVSPHSAGNGSPRKEVTFVYLMPEDPSKRARLPIRVYIYPHDATDSIITTVKNFYGLYEGEGVSFEDKDGYTLIARYENFESGMTVNVRVVADANKAHETPSTSMSPMRPRALAPAFEMGPPAPNQGQSISRPGSRTAQHRSESPLTRGRRSVSVSTLSKSRSRPNIKVRTGSAQGSFTDTNGEIVHDMSDSDGGNASVTSSRRGKADILASAEISVDNIVEGGRRKRARFDSSELPLFVPSQVPMPTSISSVSPQRRILSNNAASPYQYSNQQTFSYTYTMPSPQSNGQSDTYMGSGAYASAPTQAFSNRPLRQRPATYVPPRYSAGSGVLPTPDPTIGSVISDEDVALQLMRLGDASNFSTHGRTSTSTVDDAFSGKAEVSDESDEGSEMDGVHHPHRHAAYVSDEYSGEEYEDRGDVSFKGESDGIMPEDMARMGRATSKAKSTASGKGRTPSVSHKAGKSSKPKSVKAKSENGIKGPMSPTSLPTQSRKASVSSLTFGPDEDDLSTKPRCQRCRKSKKGCDRQRPCGRCKDAGIGIDGCVSEDEGNGRKGRYGRHMGVPVKKDELMPMEIAPAQFTAYQPVSMGPPPTLGMINKKRKR